MGPHCQLSVLVEGEPAGRRDRGMGDVHPRIASLTPIDARWRLAWGRRADRAIDRGLLQEPARLLLERVDRVDSVPDDMIGRHCGDGFDNRFVISEDGEKIAAT